MFEENEETMKTMLLKVWRIPSSLTTESPTERMVLHHNKAQNRSVK